MSNFCTHKYHVCQSLANVILIQVVVVLRNNFQRLPIIVGVLNGTSEDPDEENTSFDEQTAEDLPLNDFINFLANGLNAR